MEFLKVVNSSKLPTVVSKADSPTRVYSNHSASLKVNMLVMFLKSQLLRLPLNMEKLMDASKHSSPNTQSVVLHQSLEKMLDWLLQNMNAKLVISHPV